MAASPPLHSAENGPSHPPGSSPSAGSAQTPPALAASAVWLAAEDDLHCAGVRAIEPPRESRQAVRGSLYLVAEVRGDGEGLLRLSERVLGLLQRTYYTGRGNQTQVLAEAARNAQALVLEHNRATPGAHARLNLALAALLGRRLLLACAGGAFAVLRSGSRVELYPNQPGIERRSSGGDTADTLAVGAGEAPEAVEVLRWQLDAGDALLLAAPAWAERMELRTLAATVLYVDTDVAQDAAEGLREQAGLPPPPGLLLIFDEAARLAAAEAPSIAPGLVLKPETPAPAAPAAVPGSPVPRTPNPLLTPRRGPGALPTALTAPPPLISPAQLYEGGPASHPAQAQPVFPSLDAADDDETEAQDAAAPAATLPAAAAGSATDWAPVRSAPSLAAGSGSQAPATAPTAGQAAVSQSPVGQESVSQEPADATHGAAVGAAVVAAGAAVGAGARTGLDKARGLLRNMLPEQRPATPPDFVALEADSPSWSPAPGAYVEGSRSAESQEPLRAPPFQPPPPSSGGRARLFILVALLVALLVPTIVGGVFWSLRVDNRGRAESLTTLAQARILEAQTALDSGDRNLALNLLSEAEDYAQNTMELVGASVPVNQLLTTIRELSDSAADVQKLYQLSTPLISFPAGSAPTRLIVQDQEIYVLDPGRAVVESYRLDATLDRVPEGAGEPLLRTGDAIGGRTVGQLVDIAWLPPVPGYDDKATLIVLDAAGQLFSYDPRVEGPSALTLMGAENFGTLGQVETYLGRLYLADIGQGQMWRYGAGLYSAEAPTAWFNEALKLDELVSLRIDGDVWLLMRNGQVLRYRDRAQLPFSLDVSVGLVRDAVDLFVGDGTNPYLYIVDGGNGRIWVFDKEGGYQKQLAAPEGDPLRGLSGIFIEDVTDSLFLLTSSALYKHPLPRN